MKKKFLLAGASCLAMIVSITPYLHSNSSGAPSGYSGVPLNCTSCHTGTPLTNNSAVTIKVFDGTQEVNAYQANKIYKIEVSVRHQGQLFGFEASVHKANTAKAGTLANIPGAGTKFAGGDNSYITHTDADPAAAGSDKWEFNWTSPSADEGTLTIYTAVNSADGDFFQSGDRIFLNTKQLPFSTVAAVAESRSMKVLQVYPNPAQDVVLVSLALDKAAMADAAVYGMDGKLVKSMEPRQLTAGHNAINLDVKDLNTGVYFLRVSAGGAMITQKIVKQ